MPTTMTERDLSRPHSSVDESWGMLIHDVRNPLATAHAYVQLLRRRATRAHLQPAELDQGLQHIEDALGRIERLLNRFNERPEARRALGTDLIELAHEMATAAQRITVLPQTESAVGNWDRVDLERILTNLFENALKYSPADRPVLVSVGRQGDLAILFVADQGVGIAAADVPHVFQRGYRAANAAALAPGSGLGLAIVRNIIRRYGGEISIDSRPGVGTTVTVQLRCSKKGNHSHDNPCGAGGRSRRVASGLAGAP